MERGDPGLFKCDFRFTPKRRTRMRNLKEQDPCQTEVSLLTRLIISA